MATLRVTGMTFGHCKAAVRSALETVAGVITVMRIDLVAEVALVESCIAAKFESLPFTGKTSFKRVSVS